MRFDRYALVRALGIMLMCFWGCFGCLSCRTSMTTTGAVSKVHMLSPELCGRSPLAVRGSSRSQLPNCRRTYSTATPTGVLHPPLYGSRPLHFACILVTGVLLSTVSVFWPALCVFAAMFMCSEPTCKQGDCTQDACMLPGS